MNGATYGLGAASAALLSFTSNSNQYQSVSSAKSLVMHGLNTLGFVLKSNVHMHRIVVQLTDSGKSNGTCSNWIFLWAYVKCIFFQFLLFPFPELWAYLYRCFFWLKVCFHQPFPTYTLPACCASLTAEFSWKVILVSKLPMYDCMAYIIRLDGWFIGGCTS